MSRGVRQAMVELGRVEESGRVETLLDAYAAVLLAAGGGSSFCLRKMVASPSRHGSSRRGREIFPLPWVRGRIGSFLQKEVEQQAGVVLTAWACLASLVNSWVACLNFTYLGSVDDCVHDGPVLAAQTSVSGILVLSRLALVLADEVFGRQRE